jgi:hypothetical protein
LEDHWDYSYRYPDRVHFNEPCIIDGQHYTLNNISKVPARNSTVFNVTSSNGKNVTVPGECYFQFNGIFAWALLRFLTSTLNGICYMPDHLQGAGKHAQLRVEVQCNIGILYSNIEDYWWLQSLYNKGNALFQSIDNALNSLTTGATNKMRAVGKSWDGITDAFVGVFATGRSRKGSVIGQWNERLIGR